MATEKKENSVHHFLNAQPKEVFASCNTRTKISSLPKPATAPDVSIDGF